MPFTYELPVPNLEDESSERTVRLEKWLVREGAQIHRGSAVAVVSVSGARYEIRANGDGFLRKRLVKKGDVVSTSTPLAIIAADGESIPYDRPYSIGHRLTKRAGRDGKLKPFVLRSWRLFKRFLTTPIYPTLSDKGTRQAFIIRIVCVSVALAVGIYVDIPIVWWFMVAAIICGVLIAFGMRRFGG